MVEPPSKKFKVEAESSDSKKKSKPTKTNLNGTDDNIYDDDTDVDEDNKEHVVSRIICFYNNINLLIDIAYILGVNKGSIVQTST